MIIDFLKDLMGRLVRLFAVWLDAYYNKQFHNFPFGHEPHASKEKYIEIWDHAKRKNYQEVDVIEKVYRYKIDKEWIDNLALITQVVIKGSDICYQHGRILYSVLRSYLASHTGEITIVETGTARGFSSICMSKALADSSVSGKIITFDVVPNDTKMYWGCIKDHDGVRSREQLLCDYEDYLNRIIFIQGDTIINVSKFSAKRVNFAFFDGGHEYKDVINDFQLVINKQEKGDIVVFDDYTPGLFDGIVKAVDEICVKYGYEKQIVMAGDRRGYVIATKK